MSMSDPTPWAAGPEHAPHVAALLHDFNTEFDTPSPGPEILTGRLRVLLAHDDTVALLAGVPPVGLALVTFRKNVWYAGPVALLDELYVVPGRRNRGVGAGLIAAVVDLARRRGGGLVEVNVDEGDVDAQRFYERHGFSVIEPDTQERAFYFSMELDPPPRPGQSSSDGTIGG